MQDSLSSIKITGVDTKQGIARFGGKAERYFKTLRKFAAAMPTQTAAFEDCAGEATRAHAAEAIHTLKGVAGNLGLMAVYDSVVEFEKTLKAGNPDKALYDVMDSLCKNAEKEILEKTEFLS